MSWSCESVLQFDLKGVHLQEVQLYTIKLCFRLHLIMKVIVTTVDNTMFILTKIDLLVLSYFSYFFLCFCLFFFCSLCCFSPA